jgi:hypothetical protein
MAIPDRLFNPSPWTPTTRAPGRLVAVMTATRDHFPIGSDPSAPVGVAAGSQTYRFLDLPGQSPDVTDVSLSPDGRHLAYWINGRPPKPTDLGDRSTVGIAVLDLTDGAVQREVLADDHGIAPGDLTWVDNRTVALAAASFTSGDATSFAGRTQVRLLSVGLHAIRRVPRSNVLDIPVTSTGGAFAGMVEQQLLRSADPRTGSLRPDVILSEPVKSVAYDVRRGLVAATEGNVDASGPTSGPLVVGRVVHAEVHFRVVPGGHRYDQAVTWVDRTHVATTRQTRTGVVYDVVDVRTGARRQLTSKPWYAFQVATDALQHAESVPGIAPPSPWNPRWVAVGVMGALLLVGAAGLVVRRSRVRG